LPSLFAAAAASDAMPDVLDEDSFEAALRWRRMPLWEFLPADTSAFILSHSCVDEPDAPSGTELPTQAQAAPSLKLNPQRTLMDTDDTEDAPPPGFAPSPRVHSCSLAGEEMYGMHSDNDLPLANGLDGNQNDYPMGDEFDISGDEETKGEGAAQNGGYPPHKRMRGPSRSANLANNEDITMSADENCGEGIFAGKWTQYASDSGGAHRGVCCTAFKKVKRRAWYCVAWRVAWMLITSLMSRI
jgi:hypothetical protein